MMLTHDTIAGSSDANCLWTNVPEALADQLFPDKADTVVHDIVAEEVSSELSLTIGGEDDGVLGSIHEEFGLLWLAMQATEAAQAALEDELVSGDARG